MSKIVQKANGQLTINDDSLENYLELGYSEIDGEGKIVTTGKASTLKDVQAENDTLKAELAKYQAIDLEDVEAMKTELIALKADKKAK